MSDSPSLLWGLVATTPMPHAPTAAMGLPVATKWYGLLVQRSMVAVKIIYDTLQVSGLNKACHR
jgi:hypothetical protein